MNKKVVFWALLTVCLALFIEFGSYLAVTITQEILQDARTSNIFLTDNHSFTQSDIDSYFDSRDPILGWPTPAILQSDRHDESGARPNPAYPYPQPGCVAAFGDSFTYASEVSHAEGWANQLSKRLGCRVANFGVGGYGTDQAYLRFKQTNVDDASVVILGFFPEDIERNVNQYRGFLSGNHNLVFKPRYLVHDGELELVPIIQRENFNYDELIKDPIKFLKYEYFLPGTAFGPVSVKFPFTLTAIEALFHPKILAFISGQPTWAKLYREDSDSGGLETTEAILRQFAADVRNMGKFPLVFVFTNAKSVDHFRDSRVWPFQSVLDFMDREQIHYINFGQYLDANFDLARICEIFTKQIVFGCTGHHTAEGNRLVADSIYRFITDGDLLSHGGS